MTTQARQKMLVIDTFQGLVNRKDTLRIHESGGNNIAEAGLQTALNVDIDNEGKLQKAKGYAQVNSENISDVFATSDELRMFFIVGAVLKYVDPDFNTHAIHSFTNVSLKHAQWVEVNDLIYLSYADEHVIIRQDNTVTPWGLRPPALPTLTVDSGGRLPAGQYQCALTFLHPSTRQESGALGVSTVTVPDGSRLVVDLPTPPPSGYHYAVYMSPTDGDALYRAVFSATAGTVTWDGPISVLAYPLRTMHLDAPPPVIDITTLYKGRIYAAQYFPEQNVTGIFRSEPLAYEHWDLLNEVFYVDGEVLVLEGAEEGILVGTDDDLFGYNGTELSHLADYGAVRGSLAVNDGKGKVYAWTEMGLVVVFPFEELTDEKVHVPPGLYGSAVLIENDGYKKFVALVEDGDTAHNPSEA